MSIEPNYSDVVRALSAVGIVALVEHQHGAVRASERPELLSASCDCAWIYGLPWLTVAMLHDMSGRP